MFDTRVEGSLLVEREEGGAARWRECGEGEGGVSDFYTGRQSSRLPGLRLLDPVSTLGQASMSLPVYHLSAGNSHLKPSTALSHLKPLLILFFSLLSRRQLFLSFVTAHQSQGFFGCSNVPLPQPQSV